MPNKGILVLFGCFDASQSSKRESFQASVASHDVNAAAFSIEHHVAVDQSEQRVVISLTNTLASVKLVSNLTDKDISGTNSFATKPFDAPSLGIGVATVTAGPLSFLMSHDTP